MCVPEGGGGEDSDDDADVDADAEIAVVPGMEEADMLAEPKAEAFVGLDRFVPIRNIDKCIRTSSSRPGNVAKVAKSRDVGAVGIEKQGHRVRGSSERHVERKKKMEDQQIEGRRLCTRKYCYSRTEGEREIGIGARVASPQGCVAAFVKGIRIRVWAVPLCCIRRACTIGSTTM